MGHLAHSSRPQTIALQSENEPNDPLKSGSALGGPAGPATPPRLFAMGQLASASQVWRTSTFIVYLLPLTTRPGDIVVGHLVTLLCFCNLYYILN